MNDAYAALTEAIKLDVAGKREEAMIKFKRFRLDFPNTGAGRDALKSISEK